MSIFVVMVSSSKVPHYDKKISNSGVSRESVFYRNIINFRVSAAEMEDVNLLRAKVATTLQKAGVSQSLKAE